MNAISVAAPTPARFDKSSWTPPLESSAREVFEIMLRSSLEESAASAHSVGEFTAIVGLAGSLCGVLSIRCTHGAARKMASRMLDLPPEQVDNDSLDALGEIANMIAGNFKAKLDGIGDHCMLSVPTIIVGNDYIARSPAITEVIELIFTFEAEPVLVALEVNE